MQTPQDDTHPPVHWVEFWFAPQRLRLLLLAICLGLAGAAVFPVMSTHLAEGLNVSPFWIGLFFALNTIAGVTISLSLAKASDQGLGRVRILWVSVVVSMVGAVALGYTTHYGLLLVIGMIWFGMSSVSQPQIFALAREQVEEEQAALFQSVLRACISLSWIVGPPAAYLLFDLIGFTALMWITASLFGISLLLLPGLPESLLNKQTPVRTPTNRRIKWLSLMILAVFAANSMYIVYMPLYLRDTLAMAGMAPGLLMGLAAGLEIPIMVAGGALAHRWPLFRPLWVAVFGGIVFYAGVYLAQGFTTLAALQIFNGVLIGLAAGIGISVFQKLMPGRAGMASTLYTNAIKVGSLVGAAMGGIIAELGGYQNVFLANLALMLVALFALYQCTHSRHDAEFPTRAVRR